MLASAAAILALIGCRAALRADALVTPTVLGMNQFEPIVQDTVVTSETECQCRGSNNITGSFPSGYPYKWFLFNNSLTQYSLMNCPQTFCNLRVGLETLPLRDEVSGARPSFKFVGVPNYPVSPPSNNGDAFKNAHQDYARYSVFYQQVIWIKGVSTEEISDHAAVDIRIENAIFTGDGNRRGAGIAFTYRIPAGSTITVANNYFSGYYAQGLNNQYGRLMVNGIFPNTACCVCMTTMILEDMTQLSVSNNRFYFPCPTGGGVNANTFPFSSNVLSPTATTIYASQCSPVVMAGVQMYGGQLNITENDFGNVLTTTGVGYIAAPFFTFVTSTPGAFDEETYDGPPAVAPELRIARNTGLGMASGFNKNFLLNLSVTAFNLDDNHTMAGGRIVVEGHSVQGTSANNHAVAPIRSIVNVTDDTYYPAVVKLTGNTFTDVSGVTPFYIGFANSNATGSAFLCGQNTVSHYKQAGSTNNIGIVPSVDIVSLSIRSDAVLGVVNNTVTGMAEGRSAFIFDKNRPIVEEGADFVFGGNMVDGQIFAADVETFRSRAPGLTQGNDIIVAWYCYTCGRSTLNYCTFRNEFTPYFSNALLCGLDSV